MADAPDPADWPARKELLAAKVTVGIDLVGTASAPQARVLIVAPEVRLSHDAALLFAQMIAQACSNLQILSEDKERKSRIRNEINPTK